MPQVLVWQCPNTGKLFDSKGQYVKYVKATAKSRLEQRKEQAKRKVLFHWHEEFRAREQSIEGMLEAVIQEQEWFWRLARIRSTDFQRGKLVLPDPVLVEFTEVRLQYSDSVSNSHSRPLNGVTNWGGRKTHKDGTPLPRGYPGWRGRLEWRVKWPEKYNGSYPGTSLFAGSCIHTGTGGGGGYLEGHAHFGYDVSIFEDDWPGLKTYREKQIFWDHLTRKED